MIEPGRFDEFFRDALGRKPVARLEFGATCGLHRVKLAPQPPGEVPGVDGSRSVLVACPEAGCGVLAWLTLRWAPDQQEESK